MTLSKLEAKLRVARDELLVANLEADIYMTDEALDNAIEAYRKFSDIEDAVIAIRNFRNATERC